MGGTDPVMAAAAAAARAWVPHLLRELAHAHGLSGDARAASRAYRSAFSEGGAGGRAVGGLTAESFSRTFWTLAAHHEGRSNLSAAVGFLAEAAARLEEETASLASLPSTHLWTRPSFCGHAHLFDTPHLCSPVCDNPNCPPLNITAKLTIKLELP